MRRGYGKAVERAKREHTGNKRGEEKGKLEGRRKM